MRLSQRSRRIKAALVLRELAFLKELTDVRLGFVPIGQRDLDDNVLADILVEEVRIFE